MKVLKVIKFTCEIVSRNGVAVKFGFNKSGRICELSRVSMKPRILQLREGLEINDKEYKLMYKQACAILLKKKARWFNPRQLNLGI